MSLVGMVALQGMSFVVIPPRVLILRKRGSDTKQKNATDAARQDGTLDSRTDGNGLSESAIGCLLAPQYRSLSLARGQQEESGCDHVAINTYILLQIYAIQYYS